MTIQSTIQLSVIIILGVLSVGLFASDPKPLDTTNGRNGALQDDDWYLFGVQALTCLCLIIWSCTSTVCLLWFVNKIIPIRMEPHLELMGADLSEHKIRHGESGISRALSALKPVLQDSDLYDVTRIGFNPGHDAYLHDFYKFTHSVNPYKSTDLLIQKKDPNDLKILQKSNILPAISKAVTSTVKTVNNLTFKNHKGVVIEVKPNGKGIIKKDEAKNHDQIVKTPAKLAWIE